MAHQIDGKTIVITGASAGVGRATAIEFARRGCRIALLARSAERLESTARDVREAGGEAITIQADVADDAKIDAAAERTERELGPIDIWINNAMVSVFSPIAKMKPEEFRRVTEVTYLGYVYGTMAALRHMTARNRGTIIQVGSALAYRGIPLQSAYCGAKHAVQGFTDSLRTELMHDKSRINVTEVHLPAMNTPQFRWVKSRLPHKAQPVPPIFQPELAAAAIVFAAENPHRREIHLGFPAVKAIWGNKLAPSIADRVLASGGYESQQTDEPEDPDRPNNLYDAPPGDPGIHGVFDDRAKAFSAQFWWTRNRAMLLPALGGLALMGLAAVLVPKKQDQTSRRPRQSDRARTPRPGLFEALTGCR